MKIFAISDLHLSSAQPKPMDIFGDGWTDYWNSIETDWKEKVSDDDIVLIPGDISWAMRLSDALPDLRLIGAMKGRKILLRGNHDYWWNTIGKVRDALPEGTYAIQNDCVRFGDFLFCGSRGWTCPDKGELEPEDKKIYLREAERLRLSFECMSKMRKEGDKVVCLMHFPPFNDRREDSEYTKLIIKYDIDCVVYGHLHGRDCRADLYVNKFGVDFYLTSTDLVGHKLTRIF